MNMGPQDPRTIQLTASEQQQLNFIGGAWPRSWESTALALRQSAHALWSIYEKENARVHELGEKAIGQNFELEHREISLMLMGMALENLLKAALLIRDPSLVSAKKIEKKLKSKKHDLAELFRHAGITLTNPQEIEFTLLLSQFIQWQGRYPIPLRVEDAPAYVFYPLGGGNWQMFDDLFMRVYDSVTAEERTQADKVFLEKRDKIFEEIDRAHGVK